MFRAVGNERSRIMDGSFRILNLDVPRRSERAAHVSPNRDATTAQCDQKQYGEAGRRNAICFSAGECHACKD
jgi:hypothetical protein